LNHLSEGRDVSPVMPTKYRKRFIFQLFLTAVMIKRVLKKEAFKYCNLLVTCLLTSIIQGQVKEGKSLGNLLYVQFAIMFVDVFLNFYWLIII